MLGSRDINIGELRISPHQRTVVVGDRQVRLTSREFEILSALAEHPGWVCSCDGLSADGGERDFSPSSVTVLISRIRRKLESVGAPVVVETVRGAGYRLRRSAETPGWAHADVARELRDSAWHLQEAVIEIGHHASATEQHRVGEVLERARREILEHATE